MTSHKIFKQHTAEGVATSVKEEMEEREANSPIGYSGSVYVWGTTEREQNHPFQLRETYRKGVWFDP